MSYQFNKIRMGRECKEFENPFIKIKLMCLARAQLQNPCSMIKEHYMNRRPPTCELGLIRPQFNNNCSTCTSNKCSIWLFYTNVNVSILLQVETNNYSTYWRSIWFQQFHLQSVFDYKILVIPIFPHWFLFLNLCSIKKSTPRVFLNKHNEK